MIGRLSSQREIDVALHRGKTSVRGSGCDTGRATTGISPRRAVRQTEAARVLIVEHACFIGVANILLIIGDGLVQKVADLPGPCQSLAVEEASDSAAALTRSASSAR